VAALVTESEVGSSDQLLVTSAASPRGVSHPHVPRVPSRARSPRNDAQTFTAQCIDTGLMGA